MAPVEINVRNNKKRGAETLKIYIAHPTYVRVAKLPASAFAFAVAFAFASAACKTNININKV